MQTMTTTDNKDGDVTIGRSPLQQLLPAIYGDVFSPGAKQLGLALENVLALVPTLTLPLKYVNEGAKLLLEQGLDKLRQKLKNQTAAETISIPPEIGVPVVEKLMYVKDESLAELYVQLLASASNTKTASLAHPSFVMLIANLSPDEAALLQLFQNPDDPTFWLYLRPRIQKIDTKGNVTESIYLRGPLPGWEKLIRLDEPDNVPAYVENLIRCGFLNNQERQVELCQPAIALDKRKQALEKLYALNFGHSMQLNTSITFGIGGLTLTEFGRMFMNCCVVSRPEVFTGEKIDDSL